MSKKVLAVLLVSLFLIGLLPMVSNVKSAEAYVPWWDNNWEYRRQINITQGSGFALSNFPVEFTFAHGGNIRPDGRDIRLINGTSEVPYAITSLNLTHVTVTFEISIAASSTRTMHVYYGYSSAPAPVYPLVSLTIVTEGAFPHAVIDDSTYLGWSYTSWGGTNDVTLWNDYRVDTDGSGNPTNDDDLLRDYSARTGGIGTQRAELSAFGLGNFVEARQTPVFVDIVFSDAYLRVYRNNRWVETIQADYLQMFSQSYDYARLRTG